VPVSCLRWDLVGIGVSIQRLRWDLKAGLDTFKTRYKDQDNVELDMSGNSQQGKNFVSVLSRLVLSVLAKTLESSVEGLWNISRFQKVSIGLDGFQLAYLGLALDQFLSTYGQPQVLSNI
jgi:hypothetical protein